MSFFFLLYFAIVYWTHSFCFCLFVLFSVLRVQEDREILEAYETEFACEKDLKEKDKTRLANVRFEDLRCWVLPPQSVVTKK